MSCISSASAVRRATDASRNEGIRSVDDRSALRSGGGRWRFRRDRLSVPRSSQLPCCRGSLGFVPVPPSRRCAPEATGQRTGREYRTLTFLPALLSLLEFTRARLFGVPRFAVASMASIEVQTVRGGRRSHARKLALFRGRIARYRPTGGSFWSTLLILWWPRWGSNPHEE